MNDKPKTRATLRATNKLPNTPTSQDTGVIEPISVIPPNVPTRMGRPSKFTTSEFKTLIDNYIVDCTNSKLAPTITGFCIYAQCSLDLVGDYRHNAKYSGLVKKLDLHCENALINKVINDNKPVGGIFLLKAKYGYQEAATKYDVTLNQGVVQLPPRLNRA